MLFPKTGKVKRGNTVRKISKETKVACKNTNRNFIGIEMDKGYFDIVIERINNL